MNFIYFLYTILIAIIGSIGLFIGGLLTSLGPCSLSLLPVTIAYIAGFEDKNSPFQRSLSFCGGIVLALVLLGSLSGMLGKIYGQVSQYGN